MTISHKQQIIYLLGGWNGKMNISDFWTWNITDRKWQRISENTEK